MSFADLLKTWTKVECENEDVYSKNGFNVHLPYNADDSITINHLYEVIDKPFFNLDQAIYWCEGRIDTFAKKESVLIDYNDIETVDKHSFKLTGWVQFDDGDGWDYYQGKPGSGLEHVYAKKGGW